MRFVLTNSFDMAAGSAFDRAEREGDDEFISLLIALQWYCEDCEPVLVETSTGAGSNIFGKKLLLKIDV